MKFKYNFIVVSYFGSFNYSYKISYYEKTVS